MFLKASVVLVVAFFGCILAAPSDFDDNLLPDGRIVGGFDVNITQAPWQVSLQGYSASTHFCGGSIISNRWVLTAAHCLVSVDPSTLLVKVGATHVYNDGQLLEVEKCFLNPLSYAVKYDFDFGLIQLKDEIVFSEKVQPIALPEYTDAKFPAGTMCFVSGWGRVIENGATTDVLQGVETPIVDQKYCKEVYEETATVSSRMICAGYEEGDKNTCHGDSGGALVAYEKGTNKPVVIGIVSWARGCARPKYPTVFARIIAGREWIYSHTKF